MRRLFLCICVFSTNPHGKDLLFVSCWICIGFDSPSNQTISCTPTVTSPLWYLPAGTADIIHKPIGNQTPPLTLCLVFNKSGRQRPHIPLAFRKGIHHSAVDQIWHTLSSSGIGGGGYTYTGDLLAWYTRHSKIKYVPQDINHLSWNCHKPIFTPRTKKRLKKGNRVASWPSKQSSSLNALLNLKLHAHVSEADASIHFHWLARTKLTVAGTIVLELPKDSFYWRHLFYILVISRVKETS